MAAIELTFIVLSSVLLIYLLSVFLFHKRLPLVTEIAYVLMYLVSTLFFVYPASWVWLNGHFGVQLLINLILVIAVFFLFGLCVRFYQKMELLRREITGVVREFALMQEVNKKSKK